ncbi:MAG: hypothetical protein GC162_03740 [Planctomycetes bacterium]|nr:hypothetical protein [Planctomycetota bacterium]
MSGYARAQWARLTPLVPAVLLVAYSWSAAAAGRVPWPMVGICIGVGYMFWLIGDWVRDAEDR